MDDFWKDAEVISSYTRAEAIADGTLIDVTSTAKEAGFKLSTVLTAGAWAEAVSCENVDDFQDETGRLWDVMTMAGIAARRSLSGSQVQFKVARVPNVPGAQHAQDLSLVLHIGPGDAGEPVLTVMLPDED